VILLDADLPYRSGLSLLPQLKADGETATIPVVVLTTAPDRFPPARRPLATAVISKPWEAAALQTTLRTTRAAPGHVVSSAAAEPTGAAGSTGHLGSGLTAAPV
jgi:CheY-like chemotaxis protein